MMWEKKGVSRVKFMIDFIISTGPLCCHEQWLLTFLTVPLCKICGSDVSIIRDNIKLVFHYEKFSSFY